jgi:outer membrane protein assembly factor BamE (lipoprotein component of BamABCDE complex)
MFIKKKFNIFLLSFLLISCTLNKIDKVHGVPNLENKIKLIKIDSNNKNDVQKILGPVPLVDKDQNRWTYFEVRETKKKYGKRDIYVNDYIEIYFSKYGIVKKIDFYNLDNMKNIKFTKDKTKTYAIQETLSKSLLTSMRKRMENARKKFSK